MRQMPLCGVPVDVTLSNAYHLHDVYMMLSPSTITPLQVQTARENRLHSSELSTLIALYE